MNYCARACFLLLLGLSATAVADDPKGNYWQCTTSDAASKQWVANSPYKKVALNVAFSNCKKESQAPTSCKTTQRSCQQFIQGINVQPMWQCTALDKTAKPWLSDYYSQREDAALAAIAYCKQKSSIPETCFVNLVGCVNKIKL